MYAETLYNYDLQVTRRVSVSNRVRNSIWYFLVVFQLLDQNCSRRTVVQLSRKQLSNGQD